MMISTYRRRFQVKGRVKQPGVRLISARSANSQDPAFSNLIARGMRQATDMDFLLSARSPLEEAGLGAPDRRILRCSLLMLDVNSRRSHWFSEARVPIERF